MAVLLEAFGFHLSRVSGSHHIFAHPDVREVVNIQEVEGKVKPYQIRQFLKLVEWYNLELRTIHERLPHQHLLQQGRRRYIADIPDLEACSAFGKTPAEALEQVEIAKSAWIEAARAEGKPIPMPRYKPAIYKIAS